MKKILSLFIIVLLSACSIPKKEVQIVEKEQAKIIVASDLHYLAPSLYEGSEFFEQLILKSDGKAMNRIEEIVDTFVEEVIEKHPDVLVLTGDITYNGEKESHELLSSKLQKIQDAGTKVCILPGNHDINNGRALQFTKDGYDHTETVQDEDFLSIYSNYYANSYKTHDLSSVVEVDENTWVLLVASKNTEIDTDTMEWVQSILEEAKKNHVQIISATHENLVCHHELFTDGYVLSNADEMISLYEKYNVSLNLSGHMHIQHIKEEPIKEILTSALSIYPSHYGILTVDGDSISYEVESIHNEELINYEKDFWIQSTYNKMLNNGISKKAAEAFANINMAYFAHEKIDLTPYEEGIEELKEDPIYRYYFETILDDIQK